MEFRYGTVNKSPIFIASKEDAQIIKAELVKQDKKFIEIKSKGLRFIVLLNKELK